MPDPNLAVVISDPSDEIRAITVKDPKIEFVQEDLEIVNLTQVAVPGPTGPVGPTGSTGPQGPRGETGGGLESQTYVHNQISPQSTWTINHGLGFAPNVTVVDTLARRVMGEIAYTSVNQVVLTFTAPFSGVAYLS